MVLKLSWAEKRMFWVFEKYIFQFFASFWVTKLKPFSGKWKQSLQIYLNQNLGIRTFLENGFEAALSSKTNVVSVWKEHFSVFWKFLRDKIETVFWESEAMLQKRFKSSLLCWDHFRKRFSVLIWSIYAIFTRSFEYFKCFECCHLNI